MTATEATPAARPPECESSDLVLSFVNTRASDDQPELLADGGGLETWVAAVRPDAPPALASDADAAVARELRDAFVTILREHSDCADAPVEDAEAYLRRVAERYPLTLELSAAGSRLVSRQPGAPGAFGAVFAAAADLAARGAWGRVKVCKNPSCHRGFFDKTRNSSGLHCSPSCGSQMAMRAYRSRRKAA